MVATPHKSPEDRWINQWCWPWAMTPEQQARQVIDQQLDTAGWVVQDYRDASPQAMSLR